ncbi:VRR-NUC domain-containing protein [Pseudomonas benzenivorans]|uniref:phosphodiesterase I n=1 Tax=Pseudomonas benzenivorans TaxID=556533 RepID=A0ABY5H9I0_9PSED|nr:VRR-NUC domain-containing protein [Pseudomonas benzenivorans]UTW08059.1 VRR-NUC domain-containing protein [Pseudomonas benzenivorans]
MPTPLSADFYYLSNFQSALAWIGERYEDLLSDEERAFIEQFTALDLAAQALLVRMVMRKGPHFRASKLNYAEIGDIQAPAAQLLALGWLSYSAPLTAEEVVALLRKDELLAHLPLADRRASLKKSQLLDQLLAADPEPQPFARWCPNLADSLYSLTVMELCNRLRLLFFGNLGQDWSEFVLADLGVFRYETVAITPDSRAFRSREDLEGYLLLRDHRLRFEAGEAIEDLLASLTAFASANPYLQSRHAKLLYQIAQHQEKQGELAQALDLYRRAEYGDARWRQLRVLEKLARHAEAHELALQVSAAPRRDQEAQQVQRALVRLRRSLGLPADKRRASAPERRLELTLEQPVACSVEYAVREHLQRDDAPVHYVENTLICSLFGLLCWEAVFAPLPGAFFHPFQSGPADLLSDDFHPRREALFARCLARLDSDEYRPHIRQMYQAKFGIQSPFVFWGLLSEELLEQALACIPAAHLAACCRRLLRDIRANRAGMPDLIQFYPAEGRYRMIEVKGPGDRLQDNQKRWLAFCAEQGMPVEVCYVQWAQP